MTIQNKVSTGNTLGKIIYLLAGVALFVSGCVGIPDKTRQLKTKDVTLEYHDKQNDRDIDSIDLQHPFSISQETVETQIMSIFYEHMALVSDKENVFNKVQLPNLSRLLTKALNHAKPNQFISFEVKGDGGNTTGDLFAANGKLHWRLNRINGEGFTRKAWARNEQRWRLAPRPGQKFYVKKLLMEREIHNWIISSLDLQTPRSAKSKKRRIKSRQKPSTQQAAPSRAPASTSRAKELELERKLGILNGLKSKGLIDNDEFERRRKALLDQYF
ncbi:MAG: hypothetical protein G3M70_12080 [Candidatus Nitronauta litoralis]|uniref:SHOCT domain-containing protein n=1 Tax=Candidatus Nitronauta litoralis TaxID=2705533 RepID=A0A7T0G0I7_9BACT|nr:MAG: hypothetical protein G3M70_12080 [Candidatus Nitronauta litoralis]